MKNIPGNLLKNLEKSWNFVSPEKVGTLKPGLVSKLDNNII